MKLPARPLRLRDDAVQKWRRAAAGWLVAATAVLALDVVWWGGEARDLVLDQRAWSRGVPARSVDVGGETVTISVFAHDVRLNVSFADEAGQLYHGHDRFHTLFGGIDREVVPKVRWDGNRFALNWSMEAAPWRWTAILFFGGIFAAIAYGLAWAGRRELAVLSRARRCAERSDEVILELISVESERSRGRSSGRHLYRYRVPSITRHPQAGYREPAQATSWVEGVSALDYEPLFSDESRTRLVGLRAASDHEVLVVGHDLYPFV